MKIFSKSFAIMLISGFLCNSTEIFSQSMSITSTGNAPDGSAMLDIVSTSKGLLIPRMTAGQRIAIGSPAAGLLVYQTEAPIGFWYYNGGWTQLGSGSVTSVGATAPITSSGGTTPTIGLSTPLAIAYGGTNSSTALSGYGIMYSNGTSILQSSAGTVGQVLQSNGAGVPTWATVPTGSGTTNYLARWTSSSALGTGVVRDDNSTVGIGTAPNASYKLDISGNTRTSGKYFGHLNVDDTRATNSPPTFYNNEVSFDFKDRAVVGVGGSGTYSGMLTMAPWGDNSGDASHQLNFNEGGIFWRQGQPDAASWDAWTQLLTTANAATNSCGTINYLTKMTTATNMGCSQVFDNGTNVGISNASPGARLDVVGPATGSGITIKAGGGGDVVLASGGSLFFDNNYSYAAGNYIRPTAANTQGFFTSGTERMTILSGGNVGIGATGPTRKLEVAGDVKLAYGYQVYLGENVSANGKIGINFHTDADPNYWIGKPAGAWTQPLHIGFYTGVKIGANTAYGGTKFYNSSDMGTEIMSVGNGDNHVRVQNNLYVGTYGGLNSTPTTYGSLGLLQAKNGYYGMLFGQNTGQPNVMYDGAGNGGIYYENYGWQQYYLTGSRHLNINTSSDLGATLGISGNLAIVDGTQGAGKILTSNASGVASWQAPAAFPMYGNNAQSIKLTSCVSTNSTSYADIPGMSITINSVHNTFYVFASFTARLDDGSCSSAQYGQAIAFAQLVVDGVPQAIAGQVITDYDDVNGVTTTGTVAFNGIPVTVAPGTHTIKLQWKRSWLWASGPAFVLINPASGVGDHCVLTVFD